MTSGPCPDIRRVRVKVCGLTRAEDARAAAALGADAVGMIFYPPSPRGVGVDQARAILGVLPPFVTAVGVFVDPAPGEVEQVLAQVPLDLLQFHGSEDPLRCAAPGRPWVKTVAMRSGVDLHAEARRYSGARGLLLDTWSESVRGGTGQRFDWSQVPPGLPATLIVAGGLNASNVGQAIATLRPHAVDVNGGVESRPGIKDAALIEAFIDEVMRVETTQH